MKYLLIFLVLIGFFLNQNSDGMQLTPFTHKLFEDADFIIVGEVIDLKEFPSKKKTEYVVKVNEMTKPRPSGGGGFEGNMTVVAPGVRQYADPSETRIHPILFDIGDKALFFLDFIETDPNSALPKGRWDVLPHTFTTKGNCTGEQLLQEMFGTGSSGLIVSQNNKTKPLYTNQLTYLTFNAYNRDLISENKDFEFLVTGPQTKISQKIPFQLEECKRNTEIKWSFIPTIPGKYTFSGIIGDSEGGSESYSGVLISVAPPLKQIQSGVSLIDVKCNEGKVKVIKYNRMMVACVNGNTESETKLIDRGWALLRFALPGMTITEINHSLCNNYEGKWHPEYEGCRDISDLQCSLMGGEFVDGLKICYDGICPVDKTYTLCVTNLALVSQELENDYSESSSLEKLASKTKIQVTINENIPNRKIVPMTVKQVTTNISNSNEITYWGFGVLNIEMSNLGKTWGNLPSNYTDFEVTDEKGADVLDRSRLQDGMLSFPLSLRLYPATCDDGSKISAQSGLPIQIPILLGTKSVSSGSTSFGLYPNENGEYFFEIAAPFEIDIDINSKILPLLHDLNTCVLEKPMDGFTTIYHVSYSFKLSG